MIRCSRREARAMMSDAEFWDDVYGQGEDDFDPEPPAVELVIGACAICGATVCGYDANGLPMAHVDIDGAA